MRTLIQILCSLVFLVSAEITHGQTVAAVGSDLPKKNEVMSVVPMGIMTHPHTLMNFWIREPVPVALYTEKEKEVQKLLNQKEDGIIAHSQEGQAITRDIDKEEITPFTWKWVHFEIEEANGGYTRAYLRRPNWWLKKTGASEVGKLVLLSMHEIGVEGEAKVTKISPNQLDTRFWDENRKGDYVTRPITGKVEHYANNVVDLYFDHSVSNPLAVTTNHLIWSFDRDDWFRVDSLVIGERIKTQKGDVTLTQKVPREGWFVVYDLEIYRDHNFLAGDESILAHNGCIDDVFAAINSKAGQYYHKVSSVDDVHKVAGKFFGVDPDVFAQALQTGNLGALRKLGFEVQKLNNGQISVVKGDARYRSPIFKQQTKQVNGNIEVKPSDIKWADVDNKMPSSPQFKGGKSRVANNHLQVEGS